MIAGEVVKVAPAPETGPVKATDTPETGLPFESFTVTTRGAGKAVLTVVVCGVPLVTVTVAAAPAVFVREKLAARAAPVVVAATV